VLEVAHESGSWDDDSEVRCARPQSFPEFAKYECGFAGARCASDQFHGDGGANLRNHCLQYRGIRAITGSLKFQVRNVTRGTSIGDFIDTAESSAQRRTGLLKHDKLDQGTGLWIVPCEAVHTFFMKFAIDLIYLDRRRRVRSVVRELRPWRLSVCLPAHSVLELPAGTIDRTNTQMGDELELRQI
jgi:uncharacterized membrane protein (UPF0127 family)